MPCRWTGASCPGSWSSRRRLTSTCNQIEIYQSPACIYKAYSIYTYSAPPIIPSLSKSDSSCPSEYTKDHSKSKQTSTENHQKNHQKKSHREGCQDLLRGGACHKNRHFSREESSFRGKNLLLSMLKNLQLCRNHRQRPYCSVWPRMRCAHPAS